MPNITHATSRPSSSKTKVLLVRQPVKSVRREHHPDRTPLRLAIGVLVALGIVGAVWLIGHLGFKLGFAPLMRVPDLAGDNGDALATGTMMLISIPRVIFHAGLALPLWLMLGFVMIALPAAGLGAARPATPGGPRPKQAIALMSSLAAVGAMISGCLLIWWTSSAVRSDMVRMLPVSASEALSWRTDLQSVAGLDVLAVVSAALWVVLVMRLAIPLWLRAIAASAAFFTLVVVTVAMSISNAAAAQIHVPRSLGVIEGAEDQPRIILGSTPQHLTTLTVDEQAVLIDLPRQPTHVTITGRQSIIGYLTDHAAAD